MIELLYVAAGVAAIVLMVGAIIVDARALVSLDRHRRAYGYSWSHQAPDPLGGRWYALALAVTVGLFLAAALAR